MSFARCVCLVGLSLLCTVSEALAQPGEGIIRDARRQSIDKLRQHELLPKAPAAKPWRPIYSLDDVPEVSFEDILADCVHEQRAEQHILDTLEKIRRLDRERPNGFLAAVRKHRPDLAGLPFNEGRDADMDVTLRQLLELQRLTLGIQPSSKLTLLAMTVPDLMVEHARSRTNRSKVRNDEGLRQFGYLARHKMFPSSEDGRLELVHFVQGLPTRSVSEDLVKIAVFAPEKIVREAATEALKTRRKIDAEHSVTKYLRYPLSSVVANAIDLIVELDLDDGDMLELLAMFLEFDDGQEPRSSRDIFQISDAPRELPEVFTVSELVKINHHRNCMLCHPPANNEPFRSFGQLAATVPNPRKKLGDSATVVVGGYGGGSVEDAIRFDVTYLRPDFSLTLPVEPKAQGGVWPKEQRFDFFVRERTLSKREHADYLRAKEFLPRSETKKLAIRALSLLTGRDDVAPTSEAWIEAVRRYIEERGDRQGVALWRTRSEQ